MPRRLVVLLALASAICLISKPALSRVAPAKWGIVLSASDSLELSRSVVSFSDSVLLLNPAGRVVLSYDIQRLRPFRNAAGDFYLLSGLCLLLGAIRYLNPRYFALLTGAFRNPGTGHQWRDMLKAAAMPNLCMNIFFGVVAGCYIYYLSGGAGRHLPGVRAPLILPLLIAGMLLMYVAKYAVIRFSGWAFRVEGLADQYLFNVFLVNKITGIVLLPFVILIAFAGPRWLVPLGILSATMALALLSTRYLRSWSTFISFFQGSRFHFFTYLCASEILPMAVLVKWLLHLLR